MINEGLPSNACCGCKLVPEKSGAPASTVPLAKPGSFLNTFFLIDAPGDILLGFVPKPGPLPAIPKLPLILNAELFAIVL